MGPKSSTLKSSNLFRKQPGELINSKHPLVHWLNTSIDWRTSKLRTAQLYSLHNGKWSALPRCDVKSPTSLSRQDATLTAAPLDRLLHCARIVPITGESYRLKHRCAAGMGETEAGEIAAGMSRECMTK